MKKLILLLTLMLTSCEKEDIIVSNDECNCGQIVKTWNEDSTFIPTIDNPNPDRDNPTNQWTVEFDILVVNECTSEIDSFHVIAVDEWVYVNTKYCKPQ
jgi:hypothetical protein